MDETARRRGRRHQTGGVVRPTGERTFWGQRETKRKRITVKTKRQEEFKNVMQKYQGSLCKKNILRAVERGTETVAQGRNSPKKRQMYRLVYTTVVVIKK